MIASVYSLQMNPPKLTLDGAIFKPNIAFPVILQFQVGAFGKRKGKGSGWMFGAGSVLI
jgi:hypothetical protein